MLELTLVFIAIALVFLFLYFKTSQDSEINPPESQFNNKPKEQFNAFKTNNENEKRADYLIKGRKFAYIAICIVALLIAFYSSLLGDATATKTLTYNYTNFTQLAVNGTSVVTTNVPVINDSLEIVNYSFSQAQINYMVAIFNLVTAISMIMALLLLVYAFVRALLSILDILKRIRKTRWN